MRTIVVIPTYNEADNVEPIFQAIMALGLPDLSVLIVDDHSPDGTGEIVERLMRGHPNQIELLHRSGKEGLGKAYKAGFARALEMGAEVIVQMDADFSHSPKYIPQLLERLKEVDVVVGSRYVMGGKLDERWEFGRYLLSWWANAIYTRLILNMQTKDSTAGFKAWRRATLLGLDLERIHSNGYDFQVEMAYVAEKLGYRIQEIPIYFEDRRIGKSKMSIPIKIESALRVWDVLARHRGLTPKDRAQA
jgi:dolichol-phosphate mannosyltransferase